MIAMKSDDGDAADDGNELKLGETRNDGSSEH
jgi:hypothetical protein